jgi:hypothetical protein
LFISLVPSHRESHELKLSLTNWNIQGSLNRKVLISFYLCSKISAIPHWFCFLYVLRYWLCFCFVYVLKFLQFLS